MKNELYEQLIGAKHPCREYGENSYKEHYDLLRDADEFSAAASLYADERNELLAHSLHRYQQIIDKASNILKLDTDFLIKKKICFNFYTDIANLFGLGTQAYTTEAEEPYIGVSELSLQDIYLLQLVLLHEMQHAADFVFYDGLSMGIAERELRARLSICHSLNELQKQYNKLYKNAYIDQAYWYVILYKSPNVDESTKEQYFELLEKRAKQILSEENGIVFSPLILRVFGKELQRENVDLKANIAYKVNSKDGALTIDEQETDAYLDDDQNEMEDMITSDTEAVRDNEPLSLKLAKLTGEKVSKEGEEISLVTNKLVEWHTYKEEFKELKKKASVVITRNSESFSNIILPQDTSISVPKVIDVNEKKFEASKQQDNELTQLSNLEIPDVSLSTGAGTEFSDDDVILPVRPTYSKGKSVSTSDYEDDIAGDVMSNLSQFVNKKRE